MTNISSPDENADGEYRFINHFLHLLTSWRCGGLRISVGWAVYMAGCKNTENTAAEQNPIMQNKVHVLLLGSEAFMW